MQYRKNRAPMFPKLHTTTAAHAESEISGPYVSDFAYGGPGADLTASVRSYGLPSPRQRRGILRVTKAKATPDHLPSDALYHFLRDAHGGTVPYEYEQPQGRIVIA